MSKKNKIESSGENPKLFANLLKSTRQYVQGRGYFPQTKKTLMESLTLPKQHSEAFKQVLKALVKEGVLKLKRTLYIAYQPDETTVIGVIQMHHRGFGFVKLESSTDGEDIFIPKHLTLNAVDGDRVEVAINTEVVSEKGPEGKVVAILSRGRTHLAGIITHVSSYGAVTAYAPLLGNHQTICIETDDPSSINAGDRVVMEVLQWGGKDKETQCKISHFLGHINDPSCDIPAAIEEYELQNQFPSNALKQAQKLGTQVSRKEISLREDMRDLECITIDPTTAKDFDDALTLSKDAKGYYHLIVHIADVSHYVEKGSPIDLEAQKRCNSTYFPGFCLPMLPPALSENLCSLKANLNRLAVSVAMDFDPTGELISHRIFRSVIKSRKRFTYQEAKQVLDGQKKSKYRSLLELMVELCGLLKMKRYERGSIEFALPDLLIKVDSTGMPTGTEYVAYDVTHQMVEEFMLKANETIAKHLNDNGKNVAYRIHDEPAIENMKDFVLLVNSFGFQIPQEPQSRQLQELFDEALQTSYGQYLAVSYIRRMRQAQYSPENIGHYGLGLTHYCHFTSPIRRYIDLIIHRSLFDESLELTQLETFTKQCSDQERISAKAEQSVNLLKKLRLLKKFHSENPFREYEAVVTRVKNFGFSFEILDFLLEAFLHVSELDEDYFVFDEQKLQLCGRRTQKVYASGDRITVMLKDADFIFLESKWHLVKDSPKKKTSLSKTSKKSISKQPEKLRAKDYFSPKRKKKNKHD